MRPNLSLRTIAKAYALGLVWGAVLLGTMALSMASTSGLVGSVAMDTTTLAALAAVAITALAILVASGVTAGVVMGMRRWEAAHQEGTRRS